MQRVANCYGQVYPRYTAGIPFYYSSDTSICNTSFGTDTTTGIGTGETFINAAWTADAWFMNLNQVCDYTPEEVWRDAICNSRAAFIPTLLEETKMRYEFLILLLCTTVLGVFLVNSIPMSQDADSGYAAAYERWSRAIESNPGLSEPFWLRSDIGPTQMREAVKDLLYFGPNLMPFLVEELRQETDPLRIYRLVLLLNSVAGINLYYGNDVQSVYEASPQLRDRFIEDWDSGKFLNASQLLRGTWQKGQQASASERIDPRKLTQVRRYGIFAIPFIIENIESTNSPELFAAFLIITGNSELYAQYLESPSKHFATRDQKLSSIKSWVSKNEKRMDKLKGLHDQIRVLASNPAK